MHLAVQLISLIGCSIAVPVVQNDSGEEVVQVEGRSEETVYMYPMEYNDRAVYWEYFNNVECVGRGHRGVADKNSVLKFRSDIESLIGSEPDASSWTPVQPYDTWMQIGRHRVGYGNYNKRWIYGKEPKYYKKKLYCSGGTPIEYVYGIVPKPKKDDSYRAQIIIIAVMIFVAIIGFHRRYYDFNYRIMSCDEIMERRRNINSKNKSLK